MTHAEIIQLRLANQQLTNTNFKTAKEMVGWMCAMQAQDYAMAKWAIGTRLPNATNESIEGAINNAEIIRTHVMRPTWHFVLPEDIRWMLALTAPHINRSVKSMQKKMGMDEKLFNRTNSIIEKSLTNNNYLTRAELMLELKKKKIVVDSIQAIHIMLDAELNGIACNGPIKEK